MPLTAFIPNDRAFQVLADDLTKRWPTTEEKIFAALVDAVGVDAIEQVLLYHVVPGAAITKSAAVNANGAELTTAQGATIKVRVYNRQLPIVELRDKDTNDVNPFLVPRALDINKGNGRSRTASSSSSGPSTSEPGARSPWSCRRPGPGWSPSWRPPRSGVPARRCPTERGSVP